MNLKTIECSVGKVSNTNNKVLDAIKRTRKQRIDVPLNELKTFVKENRDKAEKYIISYTNVFGETEKVEKRLFTNGGYVCSFRKGSSRGGYALDLSFKDIQITAVMKNLSNMSYKEKLHQEKWKNISKFRDLKFHKNLIGNTFQKRCSKLPKNIEEWEKDQTGKVFKDKEYKGLFDYGVTSGCALDGKKIGEKRLINLFGEHSMKMVKDALDNKKKYHDYVEEGYDYRISVEGGEDGGPMRLFLSEEYKGCGNGHYYVGNDWNSFIYVEKD